MRFIKLFKNQSFIQARLIIYIILFIFYIYLAYFSNFQCIGCQLCGMTRAVKNLLMFNFSKAFEYNNNIWIFCIIIPLIVMDLIAILFQKIKYNKL